MGPNIKIHHFTSFQAITELLLSALYLQMNILLASSRGAGLSSQMDQDIHSYFYPGSSRTKLDEIAKSVIPSPHLHHKKAHTYILTGIPDITRKINSYTPTRYTECIYTGDTDTTIKNIKQDIDTIENTITQCGVVPVFCTITHMNITHYKNHLKQKGKTTRLHYTQHYNTMQTQVEKILDQVNYYIIGKNINH